MLTVADVPDMLDLVERTQPGPIRERTIELGTYLGIRAEGALVAMAGVRMHPPGFTEVSAVCTDDAYRGRGLASVLVGCLVEEITARGETPCLHAVINNLTAIRLYEKIGFTLRRELPFAALLHDLRSRSRHAQWPHSPLSVPRSGDSEEGAEGVRCGRPTPGGRCGPCRSSSG